MPASCVKTRLQVHKVAALIMRPELAIPYCHLRKVATATAGTNINGHLCFVQIPLGFISKAVQFEETQINPMRLVLKVGNLLFINGETSPCYVFRN